MQATAQNLEKARELQHKYLQGLILSGKTNLNTLSCPCDGEIKWRKSSQSPTIKGACSKKSEHEFLYVQQDMSVAADGDDSGEDATVRLVYCRRKMKGDCPYHVGELVTWWKDKAPRDGHKLNIPIGSPFYAWADYTEHDAIFLVVGVELTGDRVLLAVPEEDGDGWRSLSGTTAQEITDNTTFCSVESFWCPIEYLDSVSEWPVIDE